MSKPILFTHCTDQEFNFLEAPSFTKLESSTYSGQKYKFSKDGKFVAIYDPLNLVIVNTQNQKRHSTLKMYHTPYVIEFSPKNNYLITFELYSSKHKKESMGNLAIWDTKSGKELIRIQSYQKEIWPQAIFSQDETLLALLNQSSVAFYNLKCLNIGPIKKKNQKGIRNFDFVQADNELLLYIFSKGGKTVGSTAEIFVYPEFGTPVFSQTLMNSDKMSIYWSFNKRCALLSSSSDIDMTGNRYYGSTNLYWLNRQSNGKFKFQNVGITETIHSFKWNPVKNEFCVIYGSMPAKKILYDDLCEPYFEFGGGSRNDQSWSSDGKFLAFTGFGNLNGGVDIWSMEHYKQIKFLDESFGSQYGWSEDSKFFYIAVVREKLKVDNGYKIFTTFGKLVKHKQFDVLVDARFCPAIKGTFEPVEIDEETIKTANRTYQQEKKKKELNKNNEQNSNLFIPSFKKGRTTQQSSSIGKKERHPMFIKKKKN